MVSKNTYVLVATVLKGIKEQKLDSMHYPWVMLGYMLAALIIIYFSSFVYMSMVYWDSVPEYIKINLWCYLFGEFYKLYVNLVFCVTSLWYFHYSGWWITMKHLLLGVCKRGRYFNCARLNFCDFTLLKCRWCRISHDHWNQFYPHYPCIWSVKVAMNILGGLSYDNHLLITASQIFVVFLSPTK